MARNMGLDLVAGCSIVVMGLVIGATLTDAATEYKIGDTFGWNVPSNDSFYSDWADNKKFFVGDKLIFNWTGNHTVAIVTKGDYDKCSSASPVGSNLNETAFQFTVEEARPYYFICTVGNHCSRGQKLSINVDPQAPNNAQPPSDSSAPIAHHSFGGGIILSPFLSSFALYFFPRTY